MPPKGRDRAPINGIPHSNYQIPPCRNNTCTFWRPCYAIYLTIIFVMSTIGEDRVTSRCLPHLYCLIVASRCDTLTVWRPCYATYTLRLMTHIGMNVPPIQGI